MISHKRELGVDLVKIIACIGVIGLHTLKSGQGIVNLLLLYAGTISVPLFFICSGYVLFKKKEVNYKYVTKKITKIVFVCFAWEFIHAIVFFLYYRQLRNFIESFVLDFFQKGLFYHFWFFGALILLYLLLPVLFNLNKKEPKNYYIIIIIIGFLNIIIDIAMMISREQFVLLVPQNLRLWNYLVYFMVGRLSEKSQQLS